MRKVTALLFVPACWFLASCATGPRIRYSDAQFEREPAAVEHGVASFYHANWLGIGEQTASGERFRQDEMTAAHKTLPFGTFVRVTNLSNGRTTIARITDRGPFVRGRIIDLSKTGARDIVILDAGVARVKVEVLMPRRAEMAAAVLPREGAAAAAGL